jgi:hypothetical protein
VEIEDGSKSKVGDLGKLSNFHFWSFSSCYMILGEIRRKRKKEKLLQCLARSCSATELLAGEPPLPFLLLPVQATQLLRAGASK